MKVALNTNFGRIVLELDEVNAPKTTANFVSYVKSGHYNGTIFHRVIPNFMIQGGGFEANMNQKSTKAPIENEANNGLTNDCYTVAMARTNDPHSATSQFFINVKDNEFLDHRAPAGQGWGYVVFGKVISGMDVITRIKHMPTGPGGPFPTDVPLNQVVIQSATLVK